VGLVWALNGALVVFAQMPVARLVARMGTRRALVTSSVLYGLAYASVGLVATFSGLAACMVLVTLGELLNTPAQQSAVASRAAPEALGRTMGVLGLVTMLGRSLGPLVGGAAHDAWGEQPLVMWSIIGALGWLAALVYAHPSLREPREAHVAPSRS
jgi:MFS family permease